MLVDVHCHLNFKDFDHDRGQVIQRAKEAGVVAIVNSGTDYETNIQTMALAMKHDVVEASLGIYPTYVEQLSEENFQRDLEYIKSKKSKIVSIGEVGLDYHHTTDEKLKKVQRDRFQRILDELGKLNKPFVLHTRKAEKDVVDMLETTTLKKVNFHCFTGNYKIVKRIVDHNWCFSIPPTILRMLHFQGLVNLVPLSQLLTETDAPYLSPPSHERNEPAFVRMTVEKIAELKKVTVEEAKKIIFMNYQKIFVQ